MPDVLVRGLALGVVMRLKTQARRKGRSLQAEVKNILERAARIPDEPDIPEGIRRVRAMLRGKRFGDSSLLIREARDA
jgi:plasmid stability protein